LPQPHWLPHRPRAHAIVYAAQNIVVPLAMDWPIWCTDIPVGGLFIAAGAPVCSVHAEAISSKSARELALSRRTLMSDLVQRKAA
jgi:predicted ATP-grasp superfamily ATP-dependent carboligase